MLKKKKVIKPKCSQHHKQKSQHKRHNLQSFRMCPLCGFLHPAPPCHHNLPVQWGLIKTNRMSQAQSRVPDHACSFCPVARFIEVNKLNKIYEWGRSYHPPLLHSYIGFNSHRSCNTAPMNDSPSTVLTPSALKDYGKEGEGTGQKKIFTNRRGISTRVPCAFFCLWFWLEK